MLDLNRFTKKISDTAGYKSSSNSIDAKVEFLCKKDHYGAIPEPKPANRVLPDWYTDLDFDPDPDTVDHTSTVRKCAPFLDALTMGWIIPLAADIEFLASQGHVEYQWNFTENLISHHPFEQVGNDNFPNSDWPIMKFVNKWCMKVPDGYSLIVTDPINRFDNRFETFTGVVDVDNYFNFINAPFMWTGGTYRGVMEAGTPIAQVIPIKRDTLLSDAIARPMNENEEVERKRTQNLLASQGSAYRKQVWVKKRGTRMLQNEQSGTDETE